MNGADIKQQEEQKMSKTLFISADEVARELQISKRQAYRIIHDMNAELAKDGYIVIKGRVNRQYFSERIYGGMNEENREAC